MNVIEQKNQVNEGIASYAPSVMALLSLAAIATGAIIYKSRNKTEAIQSDVNDVSKDVEAKKVDSKYKSRTHAELPVSRANAAQPQSMVTTAQQAQEHAVAHAEGAMNKLEPGTIIHDVKDYIVRSEHPKDIVCLVQHYRGLFATKAQQLRKNISRNPNPQEFRTLICDSACQSCDEFAHYAQTGEEPEGLMVSTIAEASEIRATLLRNIMQLNILLMIEKDAQQGIFAHTTKTKRAAHCKAVIFEYAQHPYALFAIDTAILNLIRVANEDIIRLEHNDLVGVSCEYVLSALTQYANSQYIVGYPHLRSQKQKQNVIYKLMLDGYTMGLLLDTVVNAEIDAQSARNKIHEHVYYMRLVDFLSQTNCMIRVFLHDMKEIQKQGAKQYIEALIVKNNAYSSDLNRAAEQQLQAIDSCQDAAQTRDMLDVLHATYLGKALSLDSTNECINVAIQLCGSMQQLSSHEIEALSQVAYHNKATTNDKLKNILQEAWLLEDSLYKLYIVKNNLNAEHLKHTVSTVDTLKQILNTKIENLPLATQQGLRTSLTLSHRDDSDISTNTHKLLNILDLDGRSCDIYTSEDEEHKPKTATSFITTAEHLISKIMLYIIPQE